MRRCLILVGAPVVSHRVRQEGDTGAAGTREYFAVDKHSAHYVHLHHAGVSHRQYVAGCVHVGGDGGGGGGVCGG